MNGSGIPVTGAIPIVIPMLMKTWTRKAKTIAPATAEVKRLGATVMILMPRQATSA
jgi:hypothetical protein